MDGLLSNGMQGMMGKLGSMLGRLQDKRRRTTWDFAAPCTSFFLAQGQKLQEQRDKGDGGQGFHCHAETRNVKSVQSDGDFQPCFMCAPKGRHQHDTV